MDMQPTYSQFFLVVAHDRLAVFNDRHQIRLGHPDRNSHDSFLEIPPPTIKVYSAISP
jgi:hypothetical protein